MVTGCNSDHIGQVRWHPGLTSVAGAPGNECSILLDCQGVIAARSDANDPAKVSGGAALADAVPSPGNDLAVFAQRQGVVGSVRDGPHMLHARWYHRSAPADDSAVSTQCEAVSTTGSDCVNVCQVNRYLALT